MWPTWGLGTFFYLTHTTTVCFFKLKYSWFTVFVSFWYTAKWFSYIHIYILFHYNLLEDIEYSSLCYAVGTFFLNLFYLFIYFWLHWVFVAARELSLVAAWGGCSLLWFTAATVRCGVWASHCGGFSCCGARDLGTWASVVVARGLSSCGIWA